MTKLHAISGGVNVVDEILVGDVKYVRVDKISQNINDSAPVIDYEKLGVAIGVGIAQALSSRSISADLYESPSTQIIPSGLNKLPDEKKGNELSAMLYDKLPPKLRHPARFRTFYTDFERDTGIGLYEFHKNRMSALDTDQDKSKYPNRKADSIFIIADEQMIFEYVRKYEFNFDK